MTGNQAAVFVRWDGKADIIQLDNSSPLVSHLRDAFKAKHLAASTISTADILVFKQLGGTQVEMDAFDELGDLGKSREDPFRIRLSSCLAAAVPSVAPLPSTTPPVAPPPSTQRSRDISRQVASVFEGNETSGTLPRSPSQGTVNVNDGKKKRKAKDSIEERRTKFLLTYTYKDDDDNSKIAAASLEFTEEPKADELRGRMKGECQLSTLLPLYYYSSSDDCYREVPKDGKLPNDMNVTTEPTGEIQLRLTVSTTSPPGSPTLTKREKQCTENLDTAAFASRLHDTVRLKRPHIRLELYDTYFGSIPLLLEDKVYTQILDNLRGSSQAEDNEIIVLCAVPGAGKSRTIRETSTRFADTKGYLRIKMNDNELLKQFQQIAIEKKNEFKRETSQCEYEEIKNWLVPSAEKYVEELVNNNPDVKVLHFDEVQVLMGHYKVSSANFDDMKHKVQLKDFFMPVLCQIIEQWTSRAGSPRFIMSGTNFFSPVQFNPGSARKVNDKFYLQGQFPPSWIIRKLMPKYFALEVLLNCPQCNPMFEKIIKHVSANRRVVQYFLMELRTNLLRISRKLDADQLLEIMKECSSRALDKWTNNCGEFTSLHCLAALGLCLFPEGYGGVKSKFGHGFPEEHETEYPDSEVVILKRNKIPEGVRRYADSGGLNIWHKDDDHDAVEVPVGCLREYLLRKCTGLNPDENIEDIEAIKNYGKKVDPNAKGHLFERLLAYELTTFGSGIGDLLCETVSTPNRKMVLDGRIFGSEWKITPLIIAEWAEGRVHCVVEEAKYKGQKIVDVGVPIINVASQQKEEWRLYCKLKCGYQPGCLWKLALEFLEKIKDELDNNPKCLAIFIGSKVFLDAPVEEGAETGQAKQKVQADARFGRRFFILDGASLENKSLLALTNLDPHTPVPVRKCATTVREGDVYVSESQGEGRKE